MGLAKRKLLPLHAMKACKWNRGISSTHS